MQTLIEIEVKAFKELMKSAHEDYVVCLADEIERNDDKHLFNKYYMESVRKIFTMFAQEETEEGYLSTTILTQEVYNQFKDVVLLEIYRRYCLQKEKLTANQN